MASRKRGPTLSCAEVRRLLEESDDSDVYDSESEVDDSEAEADDLVIADNDDSEGSDDDNGGTVSSDTSNFAWGDTPRRIPVRLAFT